MIGPRHGITGDVMVIQICTYTYTYTVIKLKIEGSVVVGWLMEKVNWNG